MDKLQYNMFSNIEFTITESINEYSKIISRKYNISLDELHDIWIKVSTNLEFTVSSNITSSPSTVPVSASSKKSVNTNNMSSTSNQCCYILKRGAKSGERCPKNTKSGEYCSVHKKKNGGCDSSSVVSDNMSVVSTKSQPIKKSVDKVLRKNKDIDKFWHADTRMVFKSKTERVVIGRESSGEILRLSPEDVSICIKYGFKIDEDCVDVIDENEDNEDEEIDELVENFDNNTLGEDDVEE